MRGVFTILYSTWIFVLAASLIVSLFVFTWWIQRTELIYNETRKDTAEYILNQYVYTDFSYYLQQNADKITQCVYASEPGDLRKKYLDCVQTGDSNVPAYPLVFPYKPDIRKKIQKDKILATLIAQKMCRVLFISEYPVIRCNN